MSIREKIFIVFVASVICGFGLLTYWVTGDLRNRYSESFEEVLVDSSRLLANQIGAAWGEARATDFNALRFATSQLAQQRFSAPIYSVTKTHADIRVLVTDEQGALLFDSRPGSTVGEDYSQWRDILQTLKGGYGARTTDEMLPDAQGRQQPVSVAYVAAPIIVDGDLVGVVSIGKPKTNIQRFIDYARQKLLIAVAAASLVAIAIAALLYVWVSRPLQSLVDYARDIGAGRAVQLPEMGENEIGRVGEAIDAMRRELQGKEYVEQYVQSLTHEIKSPLTAIRASAELLEQELPAERRAHFVQSIEREVDRLSQLADRQLELASLERADRLAHIGSVAMHDLVREIVAASQPLAQARELRVECSVTGRDVVQGDQLLLRQAIDNLLRNALDFAPTGTVIDVAVTADTRDLCVCVQDVGPGIPEYARGRIFDRFYSLPRPASGRKSTGLGLNFVREVAELHGGRIEIDCPGSGAFPGTRARLFIPWQLPPR